MISLNLINYNFFIESLLEDLQGVISKYSLLISNDLHLRLRGSVIEVSKGSAFWSLCVEYAKHSGSIASALGSVTVFKQSYYLSHTIKEKDRLL